MKVAVQSPETWFWTGSGADPGLILGCCKILPKKNENRNDITMQKNYRFSKKQEGMVLITVGVQIWR